jgi:predicted O-methyltransferase YrrM
MQYAKIHALVGHVPFISKANATFIYELIVRHKLRNILELGIAHGTATCVMAAALEEIGGGKITAVDLLDKKEHYDPTPEEQLKRSGLSQFVEIVRTKTGYNWFLHDDILANTKHGICAEVYDLCLIDGPKNWTVDGAAFFMADKLLKKDGWMVLTTTFGPVPCQARSAAGRKPTGSNIASSRKMSSRRLTSVRCSSYW